MKKLLLLPLLLLFPLQTFAAVTLDTSTFVTGINNNTSSYTVGAGCTNRIMLVFVRTNDSGDNFTSVKYPVGGVATAFTQISKVNYTGSQWNYWLYLVNPDTGTNNLTWTNVAGHSFDAEVISYCGAAQTGQPDASRQHSFLSTSLSEAITVVADQSWVALFVDNTAVCDARLTSPTNYTQRQGSATSPCGHSSGDTNAGVSAGSLTQTGTMSSNTTWDAVQISVAPVASATVDDNDDFWF